MRTLSIYEDISDVANHSSSYGCDSDCDTDGDHSCDSCDCHGCDSV